MEDKKDWRGSSRQAPPRQGFYPLWGEYKRPQSNALALYRNGDVCLWCRYIIAPRDGLLWCGWTVGDTVTTLAVAAFMWLIGQAVGYGIDGYLAVMGL